MPRHMASETERIYAIRGSGVSLTLMDEYSPRYMFHGHMHLNYARLNRVQQYKNTTIINCYDHYIIDI